MKDDSQHLPPSHQPIQSALQNLPKLTLDYHVIKLTLRKGNALIAHTKCTIEVLVAMLDEPRRGVAGPSTNLTWNEQSAFRGTAEKEATITGTTQAARAWFDDAARPLTPLHSFADFCLAVGRNVSEAVSAPQLSLGLGQQLGEPGRGRRVVIGRMV